MTLAQVRRLLAQIDEQARLRDEPPSPSPKQWRQLLEAARVPPPPSCRTCGEALPRFTRKGRPSAKTVCAYCAVVERRERMGLEATRAENRRTMRAYRAKVRAIRAGK